jgi:hypothetical protein
MHELTDCPLSKAPVSSRELLLLSRPSLKYLFGGEVLPERPKPNSIKICTSIEINIPRLISTIPALNMTCYCANYYVSSNFAPSIDLSSLDPQGLDQLPQYCDQIRRSMCTLPCNFSSLFKSSRTDMVRAVNTSWQLKQLKLSEWNPPSQRAMGREC